MTELRVCGLDLSLTASGFSLVPGNWNLDWSRCIVGGAGYGVKGDDPREHAKRLEDVTGEVLLFLDRHKPTHVVIEQYAFSAQMNRARAIAELGGCVRRELYRRDIPFWVVPPATARKLLGKQPRADSKVWAQALIYKMGAPHSWTEDQVDAFVVTNWLLLELGATGIAVAA